MLMRELLAARGFARVIALSTDKAGLKTPEKTLLLALWAYEPEYLPPREQPCIHPYYPASQKAYDAAKAVCRAAGEQGLHVRLAEDVRVKPIFAHLRGFAQGRNTISSVEGLGSRFHVQILLMQEETAVDDALWEEQAHALSCGSCRACMNACPSHAIDEEGYHREKCLRNYMLSGKPCPEELCSLMGNRLLGCDECQACCPRGERQLQAPSAGEVSLRALLENPKDTARLLAPYIGFNMALPNRLLAQACLCAGNAGDASLVPLLAQLRMHPSETVRLHAAWAAERLSAHGSENDTAP